MGTSKKTARSASKDAEKLIAKLGRARGTASGYEAVVDTAAVLVLGGAVTEGLGCLRRVWECPESVHRLLVQGSDAKAGSFATWTYKKLGAWAAPSDTARAFSRSERELLADVRDEEARLRGNLERYLQRPGDEEIERPSATKKAFALLRSIALARAEKRFDAAMAAGRELLELEATHHHYQLLRRQIVADTAFAAGEHEQACAIIKTAAECARSVYDMPREALEVLLVFEWSGQAVAQAKLGLPVIDPALAKALMASVREFFERVGEPPATKVAWRPLLAKLAGAKSLRQGATTTELARLEKRLGVALPSTYAAFLSASNGLGRSKKNLALHAATEVGWFRDVNPEWIDAYLGQGAKIPHLADALRIAAPENGEVYLLNPKVKTKDGDWEAWHFADFMPGETRYASFRELVENLIETQDGRAA